MKSRSKPCWTATACGLAMLCGCTAWDVERGKWPRTPAADVRPMTKERAAAATEAFDAERNRAQYQVALTLWRQGDFAECRATLEKVLFRDPAHRDSLLLQADLELEHDEPTHAVAALRAAAEAHPDDAEVMYKLGIALEADNQASEALHYFHQATLLQPEQSKYAEVYAQAEAALKAPGDGSASESGNIVLASAEVPIGPASSVDGELEAAVAEWEQGREVECRRRLEALLAKSPHHVEANILLVEVDLSAGHGDKARKRIERLVIHRPEDPQVRRACGLMYEAIGEAERARACFRRAEELEAGVAPAEGEFSESSAAEGAEYPQVIEAATFEAPPAKFETTPAEIRPLRRGNERAEGLAALREGTVDEAEALLTEAIRTAKNSEVAVAAAIAALQSDQSELAVRLADRGIEKHPRSAALHRIKGTAFLRAGRDADAETALRESLSLDNTQALTYFLLGSVLKRQNKAESAEWHLSQAARLDRRYALRK